MQMPTAFKTLWEAIKEAYHEITRLVVLNLLWVLCSATIVLLPAATAALYDTIREMLAADIDFSYRLFFSALKKYIFRGWLWFIPNLVLVPIFLLNILIFAVENATLTMIVKIGNLILLLIWTWFQTFLYPLLMEQEQQTIRLALRNALVVLIKFPAAYLVTTLFVWIFMIISIVLMMPWVVVSVSFTAFITVFILRELLAVMKAEKAAEE